MKKLLLLGITLLVVMAGCKNKGQTAPAVEKDSVTAVIDSIIEENDTTPMPMFLIGDDGKYMHMLYWTEVDEPQKNDDNAEYFDAWHNRWALQDMFRRNAAQYTNRILGDKITKIKFVDELLEDPDGKTPSIGEIHGREDIPALCARFDFVNPRDRNGDDPTWGVVICTDSYLNSRKRLDIKSDFNGMAEFPSLPADIVKKMEKEYGMNAANSKKLGVIDDRYVHGTIEFKGEYKNAPKDKYDADRKYALALELIIDSDKVYKIEKLGYYDAAYGSTWNADDDGYIPNSIEAAFEGPKGLELCYTHSAPESFCVGMIYLRDEKLIELQYEIYHSLIDEEIPVWKKDFAEMKKLFLEQDPENKHIDLTKWTHCFVDYDNEWIWLRDDKGENGAMFIRKDGKFNFIAAETPKLKFSRMNQGDLSYFQRSGSAGGPATYTEIFVFQGGKQIEHFDALFIYGEIDECHLNGQTLSKEGGQAYIDKLPESKEFNVYFRDIESPGE